MSTAVVTTYLVANLGDGHCCYDKDVKTTLLCKFNLITFFAGLKYCANTIWITAIVWHDFRGNVLLRLGLLSYSALKQCIAVK